MTGISPLCSTSFGKMSSAMLFARSFWRRFRTRLRKLGVLDARHQLVRPQIAWYHSSSVFIWLNSAIDSR